jgi:hypothetical protein
VTDSPETFRRRIFAAVLAALEADESVRACWEGGSVAMGRADPFSDIDLYAVADTPRHDPVLDTFERALAQVVTITHTWRVDPPAFAGVAQRIYLLDGAPRFFAVDCAVLTTALWSRRRSTARTMKRACASALRRSAPRGRSTG